jgi:hypothetical protein
VLLLFRHYHVPHQAAGQAIQGQQMGVIGNHEDFVVEDRDPAIDADRSIAHQARGRWARILPDLGSAQCVERIGLVIARDVHNAVHHDRRRLEAEMRHGEDPLESQVLHVRCVDLGQAAVSVAIQLSVVSRPITRPRVQDPGKIDVLRVGTILSIGFLQRARLNPCQLAEISSKVLDLIGGAVQRFHQRTVLVDELLDVCCLQQVKCPIHALQLQFEIGTSPGETLQSFSIPERDGNQVVAGSDALAGTQ